MEELLQQSLFDNDQKRQKSHSLFESWSQINIKMKQTLNLIQTRPKMNKNCQRYKNARSLYENRSVKTVNQKNKQNYSIKRQINPIILNKSQITLVNSRLEKACQVEPLKGRQSFGKKRQNIIQNRLFENKKQFEAIKQIIQQKELSEKSITKINKKEGQSIPKHNQFMFMNHQLNRMKKSLSDKIDMNKKQRKSVISTEKNTMKLPNIKLNWPSSQPTKLEWKFLFLQERDKQKIYSIVDKPPSIQLDKNSLEKIKVCGYSKKIQPFKHSLNKFKPQKKEKLIL